jgi:Zn-finger nucleic acid-binding protein
MSDRQGVEIDYCPQCRGVWLDRGELDKIIERAGGAASAPPPQPQAHRGKYYPGRRDRDDDDDHYRGRKRKNWLEELFD